METGSGDMAPAQSTQTPKTPKTPKTLSPRAAFWRSTLSDLAIMTVIGVVLAVIGPFGSIEQPLPVRLITWLAFAYLGYVIYSPMGYFVDRAHVALDLPLLPLWMAAAAVATVPMTVLVYLVQFAPNLPPVPSLNEALTSYFYVFVIGGAVTLMFNFLGPRANAPRQATALKEAGAEQEALAQQEAGAGIEDRVEAAVIQQSAPVQTVTPLATAAPSNPLFEQLPAELGSDVFALEMEDHYVRVHTALGSQLVLMRLRDAMAHVADIEGLQVHRSWWVARGAVEDVKREGRNVRLVLPRDIEAPVSRAQVSVLKDAGWI